MEMKRILTMLAGVSLVAGLFAATPAPAKAIATGGWWDTPDVIVATRDRFPGTSNGTCSNPHFTSINAAVESLDGDLAIEDYVIGICKGTYVQVESLLLTDHFSFVGEGASKTVIDGSQLEYFDSENDGIIEDANNGVTVANITFKGGGASYGGAIGTSENEDTDYTSSDVACYASSFINNVAEFEGGAIYATGDISLNRCTFRNNTANVAGGAIYGESDIIDYGSTYTLNTANNGGAVAEGDAASPVDNTIGFYGSTFTKNSAVSGDGGAIYADHGDTLVEGSKFIGNMASNDGGAIAKEGCAELSMGGWTPWGFLNIVLDTCELVIGNSIFTSNTASTGGAVASLDFTTGVSITGSTFQLNRAGVGAAVLSVGLLEAGSNKFIRNSASEAGIVAYVTDRRAEYCEYGFNVIEDGGGTEDLDPIYLAAVLDAADSIDLSANQVRRNKGASTLHVYDGPGGSWLHVYELNYRPYCGGL